MWVCGLSWVGHGVSFKGLSSQLACKGYIRWGVVPSLYNSACVCVLYVTLSMRISVHNKSPKLFTVKLESPSRRRVKHWALERKFPDRYARRRFDSPCRHSFLFFFISFFHLQFSYPSFFSLSPSPPHS